MFIPAQPMRQVARLAQPMASQNPDQSMADILSDQPMASPDHDRTMASTTHGRIRQIDSTEHRMAMDSPENGQPSPALNWSRQIDGRPMASPAQPMVRPWRA
jgi:hypothetical protein